MFKQFYVFLGALIFILQTLPGISQRHVAVEGRSFIHIPRAPGAPYPPPVRNEKFRRLDGTMNNIQPGKTEWGSADIILTRELPADYGPSDKLNALAGSSRPSPRQISNLVCDEPETVFNNRSLSAMVYVWGQFLDHDINLTPTGSAESADIKLPADEPLFTVDIPFNRSEVAAGTGLNNKIRQQSNLVTAWIDGSQVYGSEITRALWLRTRNKGKMKTSAGNLLPYNTITGEYDAAIDPNAPSMANDKNKTVKTFVAGDVRAAEHPALTSLHVLFVREHNKICDRLYLEGMRNDEEIFQTARKEVGAYIQNITYNEFLPALGLNPAPYFRYNPNVLPDIANSFATAAYRLGHTMVADDILMIDNNCAEFGPGELDLLDVFWNPSLVREYNIEYFLKGLMVHTQYETDIKVNSVLRNFLFGDPAAPVRFGLDLAAINIQRGRDHGLANYNLYRKLYTGKPATNFSDITTDAVLAGRLRSLYGNVDNIDLWVGLLSEDHLPGKSIGKTAHDMLKVQFEKLRDGDFYYFQNDPAMTERTLDKVRKTKLADLIKRNTPLTNVQSNVFFATPCPENITDNTGNRTRNTISENPAIYPNPTANILHIDLGYTPENGKASIVAADGRVIRSMPLDSNLQQMDIDVTDLQEGFYVLVLNDGSTVRSFKFRKTN